MKTSEKSPIDSFIKQATLGLENDRELKLEVETELRGHIETAISERLSEGMSEEEAQDEALRSLGEAVELTTEFLNANQKRLKIRSWLSLLLRRLIIPVSIIIALLIMRSEVLRFYQTGFGIYHGIQPSKFAKFLGMKDMQSEWFKRVSKGLSEEDQQDLSALIFLYHGVETDRVETKRKIWEKDQKNSALYHDYALAHLAIHETLPPQFSVEVRKIDPKNSYLHLLHAAKILGDNVKFTRLRKKKTSYQIKDRNIQEQGMTLLAKAVRLPQSRSYRIPLLEERVKKLPPSKDLLSSYDRMRCVGSVRTPEILLFRNLSLSIRAEARYLAEQQDQQGLLNLSSVWDDTTKHMLQNMDFITSGLAHMGFISLTGDEIIKATQALGMEDVTSSLKQKVSHIKTITEEWTTSWSQKDYSNSPDPEQDKRYGIWGRAMTLGMFTGEHKDPLTYFKASRELDYIQVERVWIGGMLALFAFAIVLCALVSLKWKLIQRQTTPPIFLLLRWRDYLLILGGGVLAPLALYFVLTRLTPLGGHDYSMTSFQGSFIAQMVSLSLLVLSLILQLTRITVRSRLSELGEHELTLLKGWKIWIIPALAIFGMIIPGFATSQQLEIVFYVTLFGCFLPIAAWFIVRFWKGGFTWTTNRFYEGTLCRSLMPVLALSTLLLSIVAIPGLSALEKHWLKKDPVVYQGEQTLPIHHELTVMARLQEKVSAEFLSE